MILLFLILIVFISGCGQQQTIQPNSVTDGIIIKDFSFDQSEVYAGDYVKLNLEVQNVGEVKGKLTEISIYGGWLTGRQPIPEDGIIDKPDLEPANPSAKFEGESKYFWQKINPPPEVQSSTNYQFGVRVKYDYQTEYIGTVRFVNPTYLDTLSKQQKDSLIVSNGIITSSVSNGPLNVNPISGRSFIVESSSDRLIKFGIKNVGSGYPYISEGDYSVKIDDSKSIGATCYKDEENKNIKEIKLSRGETGTFICSFSVPSGFGNYVDKSFKIIFSYSYYTDGSTSITVNPSGLGTTVPSVSTSTTTTTTPTCAELGGFCTRNTYQCNTLCAPDTGTCRSTVDCEIPEPCCCICETSTT